MPFEPAAVLRGRGRRAWPGVVGRMYDATRTSSASKDVSISRNRRPVVRGLVAAVAVACVAATAVSCTAPTAAGRFKVILGHVPTGLAANVAQQGVLTVANDADNAPQSSLDPTTKQLVGFDVDVAKRVGEILGLSIEFVNPNWDAVPAGLQKGSYDVAIGSIPITTTHSKTMSFTDPYAYDAAVVLVKQGTAKIGSADQLKGKTIGVAVQTVYQLWLQQLGGVAVRTFTSQADAYAALREGQVDGVMTGQADAYAAIDASKPLALSGPDFFYQPLGMATDLNQADLIAVLNHAIEVMRKDGSLTRISEKWYGGHDLTQPPAAGTPRFDQ